MVSVSSFASTNNSAALTLLKGASKSAAPAQSVASQILSSVSGVNLDPLKQAEGAITRILLESGGQLIIGGAFSGITGTDKDDFISAGPGSSIEGGDGDDFLGGSFLMHISGGAGNDTIGVSVESTIDGGDGDDTLSAGGGSKIIGGAGNDTINAGVGNTVHAGTGNDTISAGKGNTVNAGTGTDEIVAANGNTIDAGTGDDTIYAGVGNTIVGGAGNDKINIGGTDATRGSTIKFAVGDGQDSITLLRSSSTLELGEGFTAANTKVTISDNKATISFNGNETDGISVEFFLGSALTLSFSDWAARRRRWRVSGPRMLRLATSPHTEKFDQGPSPTKRRASELPRKH
jgi:Ca2+-binding RTX toxin-like protein